ncbi:MAG TPA: VIT1/CCC1 transporter family protein, partial [Thermoplasmata archaeon]|nr:VIT1/CCC1 transporter family protein [Thermoplasmata archaeon]
MASPEMTFRWSESDIREVEANYLDERSSLWMYEALAATDRIPARSALLRELAGYERRHAAIWGDLLAKLHRPLPNDHRSVEHRLVVAMARLLGVGMVLPLVHRGEVDGIAKYRDQAQRWQDPVAAAAFRTLLPDEIAHEIETSNAAREAGSKSGGSLRSLLLGAIDGFASIVALSAGVAAITGVDKTVLIAGAASVVAGALSMAASEYVSVKAEHEARVAQTRMEAQAASYAPDTKRDQLIAAYESKGLSAEEARRVAERLQAQPDRFLGVLIAERFGPTVDEGERPGRQGLLTGIAFALAGAVPLVPYLVLGIPFAVAASVLVTAIALFLAGLFRALSSLHPFVRSGLEMLAVGMGAAAGTYLIGLV